MNKQQLLNELKEKGFSLKILKAFEKVPRENFIPEDLKEMAYENIPLSIDYGATISQPYTIAFMLDLLELDKLGNDIINVNKNRDIVNVNKISGKSSGKQEEVHEINKKLNKQSKILEIGSGSGYVLALINEISSGSEIYGIERVKELVDRSKKVLKNKNINVINKNGHEGLVEKSPFNRILVSASSKEIPSALISQLSNNGILVIPIKNSIFQIRKINGKITKKEYPGFIFVPLIEG